MVSNCTCKSPVRTSDGSESSEGRSLSKLAERVRRWRHVRGLPGAASVHPILAATHLSGQVLVAAHAAHESLMRLVQKTHRKRRPTQLAIKSTAAARGGGRPSSALRVAQQTHVSPVLDFLDSFVVHAVAPASVSRK
jgi:hypothetical protein